MLQKVKNQAKEILEKVPFLKGVNLTGTFEVPPSEEMGDLATNICFSLARDLKKPPAKIAEEIANQLKIPKNSLIERVEAKNGYINLFLNYREMAKEVLDTIRKDEENYGRGIKKGQEVLLEYSAPNPNKPMHIGHMRNNLIGLSVYKILSFAGYKVHPVNQINDRGAHICKSLWGYLQFGKKGSTGEVTDWESLLDEWERHPEKWVEPKDTRKKPDYFVMDFYVKANELIEENEEYNEQNRKILQAWESGEKKVRKLWKRMVSWVYEGWEKTYKRQGCVFERYYYESDLYSRGKEIVMENMEKGFFVKTKENTVVADLEKYGLGGLVFIRSDGTTLYQTYELALTERKIKDYPKNKLVWVVGSSQSFYFQQMFTIFELLGFAKKEDCYHLGYGMVSLPKGKMSSRAGNVVLADDITEEVYRLVEKEVTEKNPDLPHKKVVEISEKIAMGAIKYSMLKIDAFKDIIFDPKEIIKFEGNTGPYLQYAHVRAAKILEKAGKFGEELRPKEITKEEKILIKKLAEFPEAVEKAAKEYKPNIIAGYAYELSEAFSGFYHACRVLQEEDKEKRDYRLNLVKAFEVTLKNSLSLLGIETPEIM